VKNITSSPIVTYLVYKENMINKHDLYNKLKTKNTYNNNIEPFLASPSSLG
jgi:hypothetical protein